MERARPGSARSPLLGFLRVAGAALVLALLSRGAAAQALRGVVVDQTGLPLPGVTLEIRDGEKILTTLTSGPDGTFEVPDLRRWSGIFARLEGFEPVLVEREHAARIVLPLARATDSAVVVGSALGGDTPDAPAIGTTLSAADIARLPNTRLQARESLPLLPSVIRGPDGLMRMGGARPNESPMLLDGFDVTDPATGITSISLAYEAVQGVEVLNDPVSVNYGGLMGAVFKMETRPGGDTRQMGVQGFIPRPRFQSPGFGRIEGIFPRFYVGGKKGRLRYFTAVEYNFERIPVPDVTEGRGPNTLEQTGSVFGRFDVETSPQHRLTFHGLFFPSATDLQGLSVRRDEAAAPNVSAEDLFGGVTSRRTFGGGSLLTLRVGVLAHNSRIRQNGAGPSRLSPFGWRDNWFARVARDAIRYSAAATFDKSVPTRAGTHDVTVGASVRARRLRGSVAEDPVLVEDSRGDLVRAVQFGAPSRLSAHDWPYDASIRDLWRLTSRLYVDGGVRIDGVSAYGIRPSARAGARYALDEAGLTVVKAGVGSFVGKIPLAVPAFRAYPVRVQSLFDRPDAEPIVSVLQPSVDRLRLPRAVAATFELERQLRPGLDAQVGFTRRRSTHVPTLDVPPPGVGGPLVVRSNGRTTYQEFRVSVRKQWRDAQQLFVSYVRSSAHGELNDFMTLFNGFDQPLLQPGGMARLRADAPHRWLAWGTVNTPLYGLVLSPVMEWHSGFPYSVVDRRYFYAEAPNSRSFPAFMAIDMIAYKTVRYKNRAADIGIQLFNLTNHYNPRDVYPVVGEPCFGAFANSVGPIVRGFMMIKW